jgi:ATP-dependent helicase HrpA
MSTDLAITYPPELPITERHDDLLAAIEANQVLVVAGETGSGKSTQLPKLCLELGRGVDRWIGHTQPRRIAARTIADRVAAELETTLGQTVGYKVRFSDRVGPNTRVKLMTDGILLAEIARDKSLRRYDTIIIDEAHERSLNIDFILGYLHQLLPRRPDLKLIITSATIDTERFASHFDDAPVVEVSGRGYPVEIRYQPLDDVDASTARPGGSRVESLDQNEGIARAVSRLWREQPGDILVFCSGEREIRDAAETVGDLKLPGAEVLPLFGRLSSAEQQRVFRAHDRRRVVIATNVAETSVTVPGIRSVVDVGTARISRYSNRTKVQRLPIEKISQASTNQRAGRCGRLGPGVCVRLYSEDDFDARPEFTEPEIRRTNLASVILQMAALGLGEIEDFPFVEAPDRRNVADGIDLLTELDALDPTQRGGDRWLTPIGRDLAKLPIDPRYGRMLVDAAENNCLDEVLIIVAGLSIQDPRERPSEKRQQADEAHRRFADERSDFLSLLNLWDYLAEERRARSRNQFRRMCRREYLNYNRVIEWQDVHTQVRQVVRELGLRHADRRSGRQRSRDHTTDIALRNDIHRSLLVGLLSHVGVKDQRTAKAGKTGRGNRRDSRNNRRRAEYLGARNAKFAIAPGSALSSEAPNWLMAAELVETNQMWARVVAGVEVGWIEELAAHLATYSYGEPWWDPESGRAMVKERVTLYGLTLAANRAVPLGPIDRRLARELFIHHALIDGDWQSNHPFVARNKELVAEVEALEAKSRRRDLLVEAKALFQFFDERLPDHIISSTHFDSWWGTQRRSEPNLLDLTTDVLIDREAGGVDPDAFPDAWREGGLDLELAYELDPTSHLDGMSVLVPVEVLNQLDPEPFAWTVPGYRLELIGTLIRSLPKAKRRLFAPLAVTIADVVDQIEPSDGPVLDVLAATLGRRAGTVITAADFDPSKVPNHLRPTFRVINTDYELLAEGKDLAAVRATLDAEVRSTLATVAEDGSAWDRTGIRRWDFDTLPSVVEAGQIKAYPALVDEGDSVGIRLMATPDEQHDAMWDGVLRLLRLNIAGPVRRLDALLPERTKLQLVNGHVQSKVEWYNDAIAAALDESIRAAGGPPRNEDDFEKLLRSARDSFEENLGAVVGPLRTIVEALEDVHTRLDQLNSPTYDVSLADVRAHIGRLTYAGFLAGVGLERLPDVARYVQAISVRLDGLARSPRRDLEALAICRRLDNELAELQQARPHSAGTEMVMWMLEELRVSLFAQALGTKGKVSEKRVRRALEELRSPSTA